MQGRCDLCSELCDPETQELNALDCTYAPQCPPECAVYHQDCLARYLKTIRLEKCALITHRPRILHRLVWACDEVLCALFHRQNTERRRCTCSPMQEPEDGFQMPTGMREVVGVLGAMPWEGAAAEPLPLPLPMLPDDARALMTD